MYKTCTCIIVWKVKLTTYRMFGDICQSSCGTDIGLLIWIQNHCCVHMPRRSTVSTLYMYGKFQTPFRTTIIYVVYMCIVVRSCWMQSFLEVRCEHEIPAAQPFDVSQTVWGIIDTSAHVPMWHFTSPAVISPCIHLSYQGQQVMKHVLHLPQINVYSVGDWTKLLVLGVRAEKTWF